MDVNEITKCVIGAAIEVHKVLGPGLLEATYESCLCRELEIGGIAFQRQLPLPVIYKDIQLECGYRVDLLVEDQVVIEIKAVEQTLSVHEAQLLTYLRLGGWHAGLLINFNVPYLRNGIRRKVWQLNELPTINVKGNIK